MIMSAPSSMSSSISRMASRIWRHPSGRSGDRRTGGRIGCLAKWPVEAGGKLCGIRKDGSVGQSGLVEPFADGGYASVHHVGRSNDVHAGLSQRNRCARQQLERGIIYDFVLRSRRPAGEAHRCAQTTWRQPTCATMPQCPCDMYSHRQTSPMISMLGNLPLDRARRLLHDSVVAQAPVATSSFFSGSRTRSPTDTPSDRASRASFTASSTERLNTPGIERTSLRTPSPGQTNRG